MQVASLHHALLNQSLFNGIGSYSVSEINFILYEKFSVRPWDLFTSAITTCGGIKHLVHVVRIYFKYMDEYISKSDNACTAIIQFNERSWLDFRALFIKVYRQPSVKLCSGIRVKVIKFDVGALTTGTSGMYVPNSGGTCFTPELLPHELPPLSNKWQRAEVNVIGPKDIGVGAFNWWAAAELRVALSCSDPAQVTFAKLINSKIYNNPFFSNQSLDQQQNN